MGDKVGDVAGKEIIKAQDVLKTFEIEGITFKPETSLNSKDYKVGNIEPAIYTDSQGNVLFIYTFGSFVERRRNFPENETRGQFYFTLDGKPYVFMLQSAKNIQLVYSTAYPTQENTQAVSDKAGVFLKDQSYVDDKVIEDVFVSLDPADDDGDGIQELRGKQRISFIAHANTVAWAESVWSVKGGRLGLVSEKIEAYNP